jgi:hypothetical protein
MQNEEFIALLKSTVKENRLDIIPDSDLIKICKQAQSIAAFSPLLTQKGKILLAYPKKLYFCKE